MMLNTKAVAITAKVFFVCLIFFFFFPPENRIKIDNFHVTMDNG